MTAPVSVIGTAEADSGIGMDPEADIGFFSMSPASAEQVTVQIRAVLDRAWEFIALAYKGHAFLALGYASWDDYVDARFGDFRIAVPREHRAEVVASLAGVRMSVRAIAKIMGVGVGTVHRELVRSAGRPDQPPGDADESAFTLGRDGKEYPRRRIPSEPCRTCGEQHPAGTVSCPWDLYAQGIGPNPRPDEGVIYGHPDVIPIMRKPRPATRRRTEQAAVGIGDLSEIPVDDGAVAAGLAGMVERTEGVLAEISELRILISTTEHALATSADENHQNDLLGRLHALVGGLEIEIAGWRALTELLEQVANQPPRSW